MYLKKRGNNLIDVSTPNYNSNIAPLENQNTSLHNYSEGMFLNLKGILKKVISNISIGDSFVEDTNVENTTVGDELYKINTDLSTIKYDDTTHYIQVKSGGVWFNYRYFNPNRIEPAFKMVTTGAPSAATATLHTGYIDSVNLTFVSESSVSINSGTQYNNDYFTIGYCQSSQYSGWDFKLKKIPVKSGTTISGMTTKNATNTWYNMDKLPLSNAEYYWDCSEAE